MRALRHREATFVKIARAEIQSGIATGLLFLAGPTFAFGQSLAFAVVVTRFAPG
jgi:hypothetical protein